MEQTIIKFFLVFVPFFLLLFVMAIGWLVLVIRVFKILKTDHPQKYREMLGPIPNLWYQPKISLVLMKFIIKKEFRSINNEKLVKLGDLMFGYFIVYLVGFTVLAISLLTFMAWVVLHVAP